jgi:hypothetical protein
VKRVFIVFALASSLFMLRCDHETDTSLLVVCKHKGQPIGQAMVYIVREDVVDPNLPLDAYNIRQRSDGNGEAYFKELGAGNFAIYASGYYRDNVKIEGLQLITIASTSKNSTQRATIELSTK